MPFFFSAVPEFRRIVHFRFAGMFDGEGGDGGNRPRRKNVAIAERSNE